MASVSAGPHASTTLFRKLEAELTSLASRTPFSVTSLLTDEATSTIVAPISTPESSHFYATFRNAFRAAQSPREELHNWHHLVAVAWHTVSGLSITFDFDVLKEMLHLIFRACRYGRLI